jgi:hypothetical protein
MAKEMIKTQERAIQSQLSTIAELSQLPDKLKAAEIRVETLSSALGIAEVREDGRMMVEKKRKDEMRIGANTAHRLHS